MAKARTFHSSGCLVYTRVLIILMVWFHVKHAGSSLNKTQYVRPGEMIELICPYRKTVKNTPQWLFLMNNRFTTITDHYDVNPELQNLAFAIVQNTLNDTFNLKITNVTDQHEGTYKCVTIDQGKTFHKMFYVYLKTPPLEIRVENMTEENTIIGNENENLTLACYTLGGIPRGKTIWYHGGKKLTMIKNDSEWAYYPLIPNRKYNKQIYTCIAEHDMLKTPLNQSVKLDILYYPRVQFIWPKGPVTVGHNVNLSCSYYSNPFDAKISWTKNGHNIDYSHFIVTNSVMNSERNLPEIDLITEDYQGITSIMFQNVSKTDEGEYTCNVTNTEGSASETVYLVVQDNDSETVHNSSPPYSGAYVKGFSMKEQILYGVISVLVLIIMSLVSHAYIRIRCKQTNYTVPNTDVVRQTSFEIEMRDITSTEHDENDTLRNQPSLTNQEYTLDDDIHSDLSTTHSRSSSLHSDRSQHMNEDDYLHPYHSLVQNSMDVHAYAIVDRHENVEYEEIADIS